MNMETPEIWIIRLDQPARAVADLVGLLGPEEREQAFRYRSATLVRRFIVRRAALRDVIACRIGARPATLQFTICQRGKPAIARECGDAPRFNVTHSGDACLIALSDSDIGIDLERIRTIRWIDDVAPLALVQRELSTLAIASETDRAEVFLRMWVRREAVVKASGDGIGAIRDVRLNPSNAGWIAKQKTKLGTAWFVRDLDPVPGCVAAVATIHGAVMPRYMDWNP